MSGRSIRWWLLLASGLAVALVLSLSAWGLVILFERHAERVEINNLRERVLAVASMVDAEHEAAPTLRPRLLDPVYERPYSGDYWQVRLGGEVWHSRSLWGEDLAPPAPASAPGPGRQIALTGPRGEALMGVEQWVVAGTGAEALPVQIIVASGRDELIAARRAFQGDLLPAIGLLGVALIGASLAQISLVLRLLARVRVRVAELTAGQRARLGRDLPPEVLPLAQEIDRLLDARDEELARARNRAADLAHAFKTPLQALMGDAARLRVRGECDTADSIEAVAGLMRRLVDRELARSRIHPQDARVHSDPARVAARVIDVLRRTPSGSAIVWGLDAPPGLHARIDAADLTEALGAMIENAAAHAQRRVTVTIVRHADEVAISVRDDGQGVPADELDRLRQRGVRLDQMTGGHGIGLAIVAEIAEAAGGRLSLENANPGFVACLSLPCARVRQ